VQSAQSVPNSSLRARDLLPRRSLRRRRVSRRSRNEGGSLEAVGHMDFDPAFLSVFILTSDFCLLYSFSPLFHYSTIPVAYNPFNPLNLRIIFLSCFCSKRPAKHARCAGTKTPQWNNRSNGIPPRWNSTAKAPVEYKGKVHSTG